MLDIENQMEMGDLDLVVTDQFNPMNSIDDLDYPRPTRQEDNQFAPTHEEIEDTMRHKGEKSWCEQNFFGFLGLWKTPYTDEINRVRGYKEINLTRIACFECTCCKAIADAIPPLCICCNKEERDEYCENKSNISVCYSLLLCFISSLTATNFFLRTDFSSKDLCEHPNQSHNTTNGLMPWYNYQVFMPPLEEARSLNNFSQEVFDEVSVAYNASSYQYDDWNNVCVTVTVNTTVTISPLEQCRYDKCKGSTFGKDSDVNCIVISAPCQNQDQQVYTQTVVQDNSQQVLDLEATLPDFSEYSNVSDYYSNSTLKKSKVKKKIKKATIGFAKTWNMVWGTYGYISAFSVFNSYLQINGGLTLTESWRFMGTMGQTRYTITIIIIYYTMQLIEIVNPFEFFSVDLYFTWIGKIQLNVCTFDLASLRAMQFGLTICNEVARFQQSANITLQKYDSEVQIERTYNNCRSNSYQAYYMDPQLVADIEKLRELFNNVTCDFSGYKKDIRDGFAFNPNSLKMEIIGSTLFPFCLTNFLYYLFKTFFPFSVVNGLVSVPEMNELKSKRKKDQVEEDEIPFLNEHIAEHSRKFFCAQATGCMWIWAGLLCATGMMAYSSW